MYPDPERPRKFTRTDFLVIALSVAVVVYLSYRVSDVLVYRWDWHFLPQVLFRQGENGWWQPNLLLEGLLTTLRLSLWAMLFASLIGTLVGLLATRIRILPRLFALTYVGLIRNIPPLVFIFVFYFFISSQLIPAIGLDSFVRNLGEGGKQILNWLLGPAEIAENLISGVLCLALFEAAFIAEIVRAGIQSVPQSQHEAANSMGLRPLQTFRLVVLPQALRAVLPPLSNQFILLIKNSAIVSLISVQELTFVGSEIAVSTNRRFETWLVVALMYFMVCYLLAWWFQRMEVRARKRYTH